MIYEGAAGKADVGRNIAMPGQCYFLHRFDDQAGVSDPVVAQDQMAHFMKNVSLIGSAFFIFYFGSGPLSLDAREHSHSGNRKERAAA